jgi:hypothetical protein
VDDKLLSLMKQAGCVKMLFGIESGSDESLRSTRAARPTRAAIEPIKKVQAHGIGCETGIILGLPDDTKEDILATSACSRSASPRANAASSTPSPHAVLQRAAGQGQGGPEHPVGRIYTHYTRSDHLRRAAHGSEAGQQVRPARIMPTN